MIASMRSWGSAAVSGAMALALAGGAPAKAAQPLRVAAIRSVPAQLLLAPRPDALTAHLPVRVAIRVPKAATAVHVEVDNRDVSARFQNGQGSQRVAVIRRRDGLRYGVNQIFVLVQRRGAKPLSDARSFVLEHSPVGFVRLGVDAAEVTSVSLSVAGPTLMRNDFAARRGLSNALAAIDRERIIHMWLNDRQVTHELDSSDPTHWKASLSTSFGLHYGINHLRVSVVEPSTGRYATLTRRFTVPRNRDLAGAGADITTQAGETVRLNGRGIMATGHGLPRYSWRVVSQPRGAGATLRDRTTKDPLFSPHRAGSYVVGLTVGSGGQQGIDLVVVIVTPPQLLIPFTGLTYQQNTPGIQFGNTFYPSPDPGGPRDHRMQWLTLDRRTLTPTGNGNAYFDGSGGDAHGVGALISAFRAGDSRQLVVLSFPAIGQAGPAVQPGQIDRFNDAMRMIGVGPIDRGILSSTNKLVIVGVPYGGDGSGWYTHGGGSGPGLPGWLMPDAATATTAHASAFRFQPDRPTFNTSSASTATTNTMTIRDQSVDAQLPAGAAGGGFEVALIDPIDLRVVNSRAFATQGGAAGF